MPRINNTDKYPIDNLVTLDDSVIGNDFDQGGKTKNYSMRGIVSLALAQGNATIRNSVLSGSVYWLQGLEFAATRVDYSFNNTLFQTSIKSPITLSEADLINDRIDVFAVDVEANAVVVIEGVPSVNPQEPTVNFVSQIRLSSAIVAANSTQPEGFSSEQIYDENLGQPSEWDITTVVNSGTINADYILDPSQGTKSILFDNIPTGTLNSITFANPDVVTPSNINFDFKTSDFEGILYMSLVDNLGDQVSSPIAILNNSFGLDFSSSEYSTVSIPISSFGALTGDIYGMTITALPSGVGSSFLIDNVLLQQGLNTPNQTNDTFLSLVDTFNDYSLRGFQILRVNKSGTGVESVGLNSIVSAVALSGDYNDLLNVPSSTAATTSLDPTNLTVAKEVELQAFAERVDHQLFTTAGTGVHSSYFASVAIAGTNFTIGSVQGEISSDEGYFDRHYDGASGVELVNTSAPYTYVYIDKDLVLQQQVTTPTEQDWNRKIFLMRIVVDINTNLILGFGYYSNPIGHYGNTIRTLWKYLLANGVPFRIGQEVTGSPTDLSFDIAAGTLMVYGSTGNINAPHEKEFDLVESTDFTLIYRTTIGATVNQLPKVWDSNGTITPLGSTTCVAHRIYRYSTGDVVLAIGQGNYANMVLCKAGALLEQYVLNPLLKDAVFMGWWLIEETATATSGTVDAEFVEYTIGIQGGSSSGLAGALLRGNNLSDILDPVVAKANLQLQVQDSISSTISLTASSNGVRTFCNPSANIDITIDHLTLANNHETLFINKSNFEVTFIASVSSSTFVDASSGLVLKPDGMAYLIRAASANEIYLKISN
jgi:hypothetical protein